MSMREWVNENSSMVTIGAVALIVVALVVLLTRSGGGTAAAADAWFYDTATEQLFTASSGDLPPIASPEGNDAVRAHRFSCAECTEEQMFVGYYEMYSDDAKQVLEQQAAGDLSFEDEARMQAELYQTGTAGPMYSRDLQEWIEGDGPRGMQIVEQVHAECEGGGARRCDP